MSHNHHPDLAHHFDDLEQQRQAGNLGMWLFLATEVMIFGGLFTAYIVYRWQYPEAFAVAAGKMAWQLAAFNTVVLLTSSLTMALAVHAAATGQRQGIVRFLLLTILLGVIFLGAKAYEYYLDFEEGAIPLFAFFKPEHFRDHATGAIPSENGIRLFLVLYFVMTGLHAIHMIIGLAIIGVLVAMARRGRFTPEYHPQVELTGLYWHFVDIVWIFLFPLLYLVGH
ncbi:MAG: cytochrome c oxidase subunit 3 family protein [Gemmataceae bacterium]